MLTDASDRPGIDESYQTASNTSNLTVEADRRGAGDVLIASGWASSRLGSALMRLHSEWDRAAKPKRIGADVIDTIAQQIKADDEKARASAKTLGKPYTTPSTSARDRASAQASLWFARELRLLAQGLKSRALVLELVGEWTTLKGIDQAAIGPALLHWLSPACPRCDGHGRRKVFGQPALSARICHHCNGTGEVPQSQTARKIQNYFDDSVSKWRQTTKKALLNR